MVVFKASDWSVLTKLSLCMGPVPYYSVIYFGMTITRAENFSLPQRSKESIASAENTSDGFIWPLYEGVQSVSSRIETEAELDS